jgi:dTDP-4-amino-4,6-dideoxygalactose transaminase
MIAYENLQRVNAPFEEEFRVKLNEFLHKGWYILGNEVLAFEKDFASYCGAKYCIGVANGLDALVLGIKALDFPEKSEIIVPSNTYIATILSIINAGHIPVLVEPDSATCNIDPSLIAAKITNKTKAVLVVHLYGQVAQIDQIGEIGKNNGLEIIEDCAQAHGATFNGKMVGTFGKIGAYSFYPTKNLGAVGDAGAIITNDEMLYQKIRAFRNYGSEVKYHNKYLGFNSRLDELQAAFLNVKLPHLDQINKHKRELAGLYTSELTGQVMKPVEIADSFAVYHIYNIRSNRRDELKSYLELNVIQTEIHYPISPGRQEGYSKYFKGQSFPVSEKIHSSTLSLPISYSTSKEEVKTVLETINKFYS